MADHEQLWAVCKMLPTDFEPYGRRDRREGTGDCSSGCRHYHRVESINYEGMDWGVCANPDSPRAGLLTFEHQGCPMPEWEARDGQ